MNCKIGGSLWSISKAAGIFNNKKIANYTMVIWIDVTHDSLNQGYVF